jgi:hypothetical protein
LLLLLLRSPGQVRKGEGVKARLRNAQEDRAKAEAALHDATQTNQHMLAALEAVRRGRRLIILNCFSGVVGFGDAKAGRRSL